MQECAKYGNLQEALHNLNLLDVTVLDYNSLFYYHLKSRRVSLDPVNTCLLRNEEELGLFVGLFFVIEEMYRNGFVLLLPFLKRLMRFARKRLMG
ncbi:hypothetical protein HPP92_002748 [Vanilla planifolia]|uniref:Uncharacterized protein n=1 Tax=Vanilla planifolia TaxID=51239 RepID=A0A835S5W2_VANPL|nr:hypothetical protein HPP92_002748 [Vanilla planifolia]